MKIVASSKIEKRPPTSSWTKPESLISPLSTILLSADFSELASVIATKWLDVSLLLVWAWTAFFAKLYPTVVSKVVPDFETTKNKVLSIFMLLINLSKLMGSTDEKKWTRASSPSSFVIFSVVWREPPIPKIAISL